jgi:hypothetical protein
MKIACAEDCGNSPKKKLLKEWSIAAASHDIDFCAEWAADDVVWEIVGDRRIEGKDLFVQALRQWQGRIVEQLRIENIITHGNVGSVNGTIVLDDQRSFAFCNVNKFSSGKQSKIKAITSYVIELRPGGGS